MISSDGVKRREWLEADLVLSGGCRPRGIEPEMLCGSVGYASENRNTGKGNAMRFRKRLCGNVLFDRFDKNGPICPKFLSGAFVESVK